MSALNSHSRSSIDLAPPTTDSITPTTIQTRSKPTRLQHSPSLPNIWFPPHSGPIPQEFETVNKPDLLRPPTPESLKMTVPPHPTSASVPSEISKITGTHRKPRKDYGGVPVQSLLTPPLTPSSSIRTTASLESTFETLGSQRIGNQDVPEDFKDSDVNSTRFLILGNVNRHVSLEILEVALLEALAADASLPQSISLTGSRASLGSKSMIKAVNHRFQQSEGQVPFIFFDIRHASAVQRCLSKMQIGRLADCMDVKHNENGSPACITCESVNAEELAAKIGNSTFLEASDGCFYVSVKLMEHGRWMDGNILQESSHNSQSPGETTTSGRIYETSKVADTNPRAINIGIVKNLLKSFGDLYSFSFIRDDVEGEKIFGKSFHVEYYDIRDADSAYQALSYKVMFGMNIDVYGRTISRASKPMKGEENEAKAIAALADLSIGPSGYHSHIREPFENRPPQWEGTDPAIVCYTADQNCRYCPSRGPLNAQYTFSVPATPSPPLVLYPPQIPPSSHIPHIVMSPPPPSLPQNPNNFIYDVQQPMIEMPHWAFENAMAVAAGNSLHAPLLAPSLPTPFWTSNGHSGGYFQPRQMPTTGVPQAVNSTFNDLQVVPPTNDGFVNYTPTKPSPAFQFGQIQANGSQPSPASDNSAKNQLNLAVIGGGHDTRTTVMIKNIPNKMNDKDLITYIAKVCPRRVDFLYLRMDFQNGCNVGYAFVNFIKVEDLLQFAKAKLGEKWNMFSSEKVLQMSYANYQGKEALVEKFKNSCIMDEREAWRPKIFYSSGQNEGLPEPFPAPTHIRRKERSSFNRGALFVPGVHAGGVLSNSQHSGNGHSDRSTVRRGIRRSRDPITQA